MDLGIQGRKAIVMASSQGLGRACALALAAEGCEVIVNGRDAGKLEATRKEIQAATGSKITAAVAEKAFRLPGLVLRRVIVGYVPASGMVLPWWVSVVSGMMADCDRCGARGSV